MNQLSPIEVEKFKIIKAVRSNIRLKHSLAADEELNEKLPDIIRAIDAAIQAGTVYELDIRSVLEDTP